MKMPVLEVAAAATLMCAGADAEGQNLRALMESTNLWNVSIRQYVCCVESNVAALAVSEGDLLTTTLQNWYIPMLSLPSCTNDSLAYSAWQGVKERCVFKYGRLFVGSESGLTNVWIATAGLLGETRAKMMSRQELQSAVQSIVHQPGTTPLAEKRGRVYDIATEQSANEGLSAVLCDVVVNTYGKRGIAQLPSAIRMQVYSNLVERACLTEDETLRILNALAEPAAQPD